MAPPVPVGSESVAPRPGDADRLPAGLTDANTPPKPPDGADERTAFEGCWGGLSTTGTGVGARDPTGTVWLSEFEDETLGISPSTALTFKAIPVPLSSKSATLLLEPDRDGGSSVTPSTAVTGLVRALLFALF